jgi:hypothetical protein
MCAQQAANYIPVASGSEDPLKPPIRYEGIMREACIMQRSCYHPVSADGWSGGGDSHGCMVTEKKFLGGCLFLRACLSKTQGCRLENLNDQFANCLCLDSAIVLQGPPGPTIIASPFYN